MRPSTHGLSREVAWCFKSLCLLLGRLLDMHSGKQLCCARVMQTATLWGQGNHTAGQHAKQSRRQACLDDIIWSWRTGLQSVQEGSAEDWLVVVGLRA